MTEYFVLAVDKCDACDGTGVLYNATWKEWSNSVGSTIPTGPDEDEWADFNRRARAWWAARGFNPDRLPHEEAVCGNCHGTGKAKRRVPLREALDKIGLTIETKGGDA